MFLRPDGLFAVWEAAPGPGNVKNPIDGRSAHGETLITVPISGNLRANNGDSLRAASIAGQGLIYQPTFVVSDDLRAGTLVALTMDQPTVEFGGIYAVYLPDRHPAAKVRAFIDFIATRFSPDPPWDRILKN